MGTNAHTHPFGWLLFLLIPGRINTLLQCNVKRAKYATVAPWRDFLLPFQYCPEEQSFSSSPLPQRGCKLSFPFLSFSTLCLPFFAPGNAYLYKPGVTSETRNAMRHGRFARKYHALPIYSYMYFSTTTICSTSLSTPQCSELWTTRPRIQNKLPWAWQPLESHACKLRWVWFWAKRKKHSTLEKCNLLCHQMPTNALSFKLAGLDRRKVILSFRKTPIWAHALNYLKEYKISYDMWDTLN